MTKALKTDKPSAVEETIPQPFLKWAGGKRALLPKILPLIPDFNGTYIEPFLGAGAVFFSQAKEQKKLLNDFNSDLVEVYEVIRDKPEQLLKTLRTFKNEKSIFLEIRAWDRDPQYKKLKSKVQRAARFIYLNKTCFNGLYRVNSKGFYNVPFGNSKNPDFIAEANIKAVSLFLNQRNEDGLINEFLTGDYRNATKKATNNDFVYLDPPYDPISETSAFVSYQKTGFNRDDQEELRDELIRLTKLGVPVLLSNSATDFIKDLYSDKQYFEFEEVPVNRVISAKAS